MVLRKLTYEQYLQFCSFLQAKAYAEPLDAGYLVNMTVNGDDYVIKVQPDSHNKVAILQALRSSRETDGLHVELITNNNLLTAFFELLLYQGVA